MGQTSQFQDSLWSGDQNGGTGEATAAKVRQRGVGLVEAVGFSMRAHTCLTRGRKEGLRVVPGQIDHGNQFALVPEQRISHGRDIAHVDATADHPAALADGGKSSGHQRADGSENNCRVERPVRQLIRATGPFRSKFTRESLRFDIARAGEGGDLPTGKIGSGIVLRGWCRVGRQMPPVQSEWTKTPVAAASSVAAR